MQICKNVDKKITEVFEETVEKWIEKVEEICDDLPWPLDWFCHAVTTLIKVVETVVKTVVRVVVTVVCYPLAVAVTLIAEVIQLVFLIPILGPIIKWWIGAVVWLWSQWVGFWDDVAGLVGIRPIKHLRLEVIILMHPDRTLTVSPTAVAPLIARTESIYRARADVKVHTTIHQVDTPSPGGALTIGTEIDPFFGLLAEDTTEAGLYFQKTITEMLWEDNPWFVIRVGAPIVAFVVDQVEGWPAGCSAGPVIDYICVEGSAFTGMPGTLLAHEMGHALGLLHDDATDCLNGDVTNLMYCRANAGGVRGAQARGDNLSPFQRAIVRSSPHVTYV
jgi:hypothetical protein